MKRFRLFVLFLVAVLSTNHLYCAEETDTVWTKFIYGIVKTQFSTDDNQILTSGSSDIIIVNTQSGEQIKQLPGNGGYTPDGTEIYSKRIAIDNDNLQHPYIEFYDAYTFELKRTVQLEGITGSPGIAISPDMQTIVAIGQDNLIFFNANSGKIIKKLDTLDGENRPVRIDQFVYSKDGKEFIFTYSDPVKGSYWGLYFLNTQTYLNDYKSSLGRWFLSISNDGSMIAFNSGESSKAVSIMNSQNYEIIGSIPGTASWITSLTFSPDNRYLAVSDLEYKKIIYKTSDLNQFASLNVDGAYFGSMDITKNDKYLVGAAGSLLILCNLTTTGILNPEEGIDKIYPNPTNNQVTTSFILSAPSQLNFNLYDVTGRMITRLKNGFYNAGQITENFILGNLPNGTYLLKIESPKFNKTFQVIIKK